VARAAEAQGVSVATAYKWLGRWRVAGDAGLADRSCRPHTSPRRLPTAREQAILAWRQAHRVGPHRIGWALGEAPSTVHAVLARHQLPGCGSWTGRPGRWRATNASGQASWSMSTSSP
jgi:transposase